MSLTAEDKAWIAEVLDEKLRLQASQFDEKLARQSREFGDKLEQHSHEFSEKVERVETNLLTEFHKWASPFEARQRSHAAALRALDLETEAQSDQLKAIAERLKKLEERR